MYKKFGIDAKYINLYREIIGKIDNQSIREILLAAHGKKVTRLSISEDQIHWIVHTLESAGLWVDLHNEKYILTQDQGKGGWTSGFGMGVPLDSTLTGYIFLYTGTDPAQVVAAKKAEHSYRFSEFGSYLNYPSCCIEFYEMYNKSAEKEQGDFILPLLEKSVKLNKSKPDIFPFWTNVASQYFGYGLLSFYPCSFYCNSAITLAQEAWQILASYDSELADAFLNVSRKPILYTEYEGIYSFDKSELSGDTLTYDTKSTQYTLNGVIASLLSEGNKIKIRSHNSVDIMNGSRHIAHLESPKMGMLLFG